MYLYEEKQIRVLALWCGAVALLDVVGCNVDTLEVNADRQHTICRRQPRRAHHLGCCRNTIFGFVM